MNQQLSTSNVITDTQDFINNLVSIGEGDTFMEMKSDFLSMCFSEFVGSERFSQLDGKRRKHLFDSFELLQFTLEELGEFVKKYPEGIPA